MSTEELKLRLFRQVDTLGRFKLKEFYGVMLNYLNSTKDTADWIGISEIGQKGIEEAILQIHKGKGISNEQVMAKAKSKYSLA